MSSSRSVKSRVTPEGTLSAERTIVAQSFLLAEAEEYPSSPEKVHEARLCRLRPTSAGEGPGVGSGAGVAKTAAAPKRAATTTREEEEEEEVYMINTKTNE